MCAPGGASFKVKCSKILHRVPTVGRLSKELLALLARVDVSLLCCFVW